MAEVLAGVRVLDLSTGPVGGVATTVLADFGADVVKVEPPGGDRFRALAASPLWLRGKRSVELDLHDEGERRRLEGLLHGADVLVVAGPPSRALRWGADAGALLPEHPRLVHCAITPFGPRGPLAEAPGYDALVAAHAGRMQTFARQLRREGPGFAALPVAQHACAMGAVQGILAALLARQRSGRGQRVETSLLQALMSYDLVELLLVQLAERSGAALPDASFGDMPTLNYHPVLAADGRWIQCGNLLEHLFYAFLDAIELLPELLAEERFQAAPAAWDPATVEAARERILLRVRERPAEHWMEAFRKNGNVAAEPFLTSQEALDHPDLAAGGNLLVLHDPERGPVRMIGPIARLHVTPARTPLPAPAVGEHTEALLAASWPPRREEEPGGEPRPPATARGAAAGRPLEGLVVLDFSTIIAGPLGMTQLADLGARVIKVESPSGDPYRHLLPQGLMAVKTNAGKESIAIDLKGSEGRAVLGELVRRADVVVHNFRAGVPERLGITYEDCRALRPDVVWVAVHGYGPDGPSARRPATHPVVGAAMGGAALQGGPALRGQPGSLEEIRETARQLMRANEANPDPNTSAVLAAAVLLALLARERHGAGQRVDVSMLVANAWANADDFLAYDDKPARPQLDDALLGFAPGYRLYAARRGWVALAVTTEPEWRRLAEAARAPELADPGLRSAERLAAIFATRDAEAWQQALLAAGVGCVRADAAPPGAVWARDAQVVANGFVPRTHHARFGPTLRWGPLVTVGGPAAHYGPGALIGDHTDALLRELGRSPDQIARLRAAGVVGSEPVSPSA